MNLVVGSINFLRKSRHAKLIASIVIAVILAISVYAYLPVLSLRFSSLWYCLIVVSIIIELVFWKRSTWIKLLPALIIAIYVILVVASSPLFRSYSYRNLLPPIEEKNFSSSINPVDITQVPTVNPDYARLLADKKIGQDATLGSRAELGDLTLQSINNKLYYVAPLLHSGFFKWAVNGSTPGYIMVSATDDQDVKLVTNYSIVYQPKAWFGQNASRKIYTSGNEFKGFCDMTFEIDNSGKPFWTASIYEHKIGLSGVKVIGVAILNATTGEVKNYSLNNIPTWVDRVQPASVVKDNIDYYGKYIHGIFNFSGNDKFQTTSDLSLIYNKGKCYFYSGITSIGSDSSTIGFTLTDSKTEKTTEFKISGATENSAMKSAEGKVQNLNYSASFPVLINVQNVPTYFTTLNDKTGLTKMFAMVSVVNYNIVGVGNSIQECQSNYIETLSEKGNSLNESSGSMKSVKGTINRIGSYINNNSTYYTFTLKEQPNKIYSASPQLSAKLPLTGIGDAVIIKYVDTKQPVQSLNSFDNLSITEVNTGK
ncbi:cell shape-determining protein [Clostridium sp. WILCCON 0269]|uniref:Cell shape-determining protein n=1 Tax=Candidatus Clostridium eludens TaxID=3381663 RepID=A0ABW8SI39_9CLOT